MPTWPDRACSATACRRIFNYLICQELRKGTVEDGAKAGKRAVRMASISHDRKTGRRILIG